MGRSLMDCTTPLSAEVAPQRSQAAVTIPRALAYMTLVGLNVLFLWLTLRVDLVIFAGVLLAVCLRQAAN